MGLDQMCFPQGVQLGDGEIAAGLEAHVGHHLVDLGFLASCLVQVLQLIAKLDSFGLGIHLLELCKASFHLDDCHVGTGKLAHLGKLGKKAGFGLAGHDGNVRDQESAGWYYLFGQVTAVILLAHGLHPGGFAGCNAHVPWTAGNRHLGHYWIYVGSCVVCVRYVRYSYDCDTGPEDDGLIGHGGKTCINYAVQIKVRSYSTVKSRNSPGPFCPCSQRSVPPIRLSTGGRVVASSELLPRGCHSVASRDARWLLSPKALRSDHRRFCTRSHCDQNLK